MSHLDKALKKKKDYVTHKGQKLPKLHWRDGLGYMSTKMYNDYKVSKGGGDRTNSRDHS